MSLNSRTKRPIGRQVATPPRGGAGTPGPANGLSLPHERDESNHAPSAAPDPVMVQAKRDIDAGMVDTDMHATPGLDTERRDQLVPGPVGKPPPPRP